MKTALYAGSFDPFTNGHLDILTQASKIFDKVIIAVAVNSEKKALLPLETRIELIRKSITGLNNVSVDSYDGLTVEYAKKHDIKFLVRGVRNSSDFDYELQISTTNKLLDADIATVLLAPKPENAHISSTIVREIYKNGGDISKFVPNLW